MVGPWVIRGGCHICHADTGMQVRMNRAAFETTFTVNPPGRYQAELDEARDNQALIMRAVNSHAELLAALKGLHLAMAELLALPDKKRPDSVWAAARKAQSAAFEAIAKAEGRCDG